MSAELYISSDMANNCFITNVEQYLFICDMLEYTH